MFCRRCGNYPINKSHWKCRRVFIVHLLHKFPYIAVCVCFWCESKLRFCNKIDYLVGRHKVTGIEIKATLAPPNDYLPYRKTTHYVLPRSEEHTSELQSQFHLLF